MDILQYRDIKIYAHHGVHDEERTLGQYFLVDLDIEFDFSDAVRSDNIHDTIHYAELYRVIVAKVQEENFNLLEKLADYIGHAVLGFSPRIENVTVNIRKAQYPFDANIGGIRLQRTVTKNNLQP